MKLKHNAPLVSGNKGVKKMNEIITTVIGNVVTDVVLRTTPSGKSVANFRIASNSKKYEKSSNTWVDLDPNFFSVSSWGSLAENISHSVYKGQPLVVTGRLKIRQWQEGEKSGTSAEIEALAIGHDLSFGKSEFIKIKKVNEILENDSWAIANTESEINAA
jgi:single-strand DNA-binding protein